MEITINDCFKHYYSFLDYLFSINGTMVSLQEENCEQGVFLRNDIFRQKSLDEKILDNKISIFSEQRNQVFYQSKNKINKDEWDNVFIENVSQIIELYNKANHESINFNDLARNGKIINYSLLNKIKNNGENFKQTGKIGYKYKFCVYNFFDFYESYKRWLAISELIDVLSADIKNNGYKSMYFGRPINDNIKSVSIQKLNTLIVKIKELLRKNNNKVNKDYKKIINLANANADETEIYKKINEEFEIISLNWNLLSNAYRDLSILTNRAKSANYNLDESNFNLFNLFSKKNHLIKDVYVHLYEIEQILIALKHFPELKEYYDYFYNLFYNQNAKTQENFQ